VQALARRHTVVAINKLVELLENGESDHVKLAAAKLLLERGWGQPCLPIAGAGDDGAIVVRVLTLTDPDEAWDEPDRATRQSVQGEAPELLSPRQRRWPDPQAAIESR
jgi:hypothetical protein